MRKKTLNNLLFSLVVLTISFVWQSQVSAINCPVTTSSDWGYGGVYYETKECLCYYYPDASVCSTDDTEETAPLKIYATNGTDKVTGVGYKVYENSTCTGTAKYTATTIDGQNTHEISLNSSYCIKVTSVPSGYQTPSNITGTMTSSTGVIKKITLTQSSGSSGDDTSGDTGSMETTSIDISFRDTDTGDYVSGVGFTIYQYVTSTGCSGEELATGTSLGGVMDFPFKAYTEDIEDNSSICILVDSVPSGYAMPDPDYEVGIYESATTILLNPSDESTGTLKLSFKDSETGSYIKGIKWAITDTYSSTNGCSGTTIKTGTSSSGVSSITLPLSSTKYCLQITEVPDTYSTPQDTSISMSSSTVTKSISVDEKVIVDDTLSNISIAIIIVGILGLGTGAYLIYKNKKEKKLSE